MFPSKRAYKVLFLGVQNGLNRLIDHTTLLEPMSSVHKSDKLLMLLDQSLILRNWERMLAQHLDMKKISSRFR